MNSRSIITLALISLAIASDGQAAIANLIRGDFRNDTGTFSNAAGRNPGVVSYGGHLSTTDTHTAAATPGGPVTYVLRESAFGQPVSTWLPAVDYATLVVNDVKAQLYPGANVTRAAMPDSPAPLRAKYLTYGDDPNDGSPAIVNLFEQTFKDVLDDSNPWFNDDDRTNIQVQIAILRDALAVAPLDVGLRHLLLDIYYDWATIEMQFARKYLAQIAAVRIGEVNGTNLFIIDDEITLQRRLVAICEQVVQSYGDLLTTRTAADPADFDSHVPPGQPLGQYIFAHEQPARTQAPASYVTAGGGLLSVDPTAAGFTGYKDYRTLLSIVGRFIQHKTNLARLLGLRKGPDDLTEARRLLGELQEVPTVVAVYQGLFPGVDFDTPALDGTGVRGALAGIASAQGDSAGVRSFLNGTSNLLGLDPNFLLLLPADTAPGGLSDSFDIFRSRFFNDADLTVPTGPLGVAKSRFNEAKTAFHNFVESAAQTQTQYDNLQGEFKTRFQAITGYNYDTERSQWNYAPKPDPAPSELATAKRNSDNLITQLGNLGEDTTLILKNVELAKKGVENAVGQEGAIQRAYAEYFSKTASAWNEIHYQSGLAAGVQAATDGVYEAAGADGATTLFSAGGNLAAIAVTTSVNVGVQTDAARFISKRTQEIEAAGLNLDQSLALLDVPVAINDARMTLVEQQRGALANAQAIADKKVEIAQATADWTALLMEVERIQDDLKSGRAALARSQFADPIHYLRAERELIRADREFRNAQRWVFFALRALEYKWQERFAISPEVGDPWDAGSIFRMRNADELVELFQKMDEFDSLREANAGTRVTTTEVISMRDHIVSPNPDDPNLTFSVLIPDKGIRYFGKDQTGKVLTPIQHFRARLRFNMPDASAPVKVSFNTTGLQKLGSFFAEGNYRDKILWTAVNIIASDAPAVPSVNGKQGRLRYGGETYFRTRVPLCKLTLQPGQTQASQDAYTPSRDFPAGLMIAPFRYFVINSNNSNFTNTFESFDYVEPTSLKFAYSSHSAAADSALLARLADFNNGFQSYHFGELSVAATGWVLQIDGGQVDLNKVEDIELIVVHRARARAQILPCP